MVTLPRTRYVRSSDGTRIAYLKGVPGKWRLYAVSD
jgi:hypothetical protein